jgi:hypothetical protein
MYLNCSSTIQVFMLLFTMVRTLTRTSIHSFIHSFTHSFIHSFTHSFIHTVNMMSPQHTGTCRRSMYKLVEKRQLPCHLDNRMNGNIVTYFIECKHPLHLHHIHRSNVIPFKNKRSIVMHVWMYWAERSSKFTKPDTPSFINPYKLRDCICFIEPDAFIECLMRCKPNCYCCLHEKYNKQCPALMSQPLETIFDPKNEHCNDCSRRRSDFISGELCIGWFLNYAWTWKACENCGRESRANNIESLESDLNRLSIN